jgi:perosamine synthetase
MKIPVAKPYLTEDEAKNAYDTVLSHWVTQGPRVEEFEKKFASYVGSTYAVAVSSCTSALHLSLIVAGIRKEDEVICPSLSFIATANSILMAGAKPVFGEVDPDTLNLDTEKTEKLITSKTKAIILVHQLGKPAAIDAFKTLCKKYNLLLIEDAACAAGSSYKNKKIGSHSDLVCFSFHPRKVITTGDGGMITTNNKDYYTRLKLLRQHGMSLSDLSRHSSDKVLNEEYLEPGYNYRMTDIQAAIGIKQLEKLDWLVEERRKLASNYHVAFKAIDCIKLPVEEQTEYSNYQSYSIYLKENCPISRDELMQKLLEKGISTRRGVMTIHREAAYKKIYSSNNLSISEKVSDRSIIIPLYVPMTKEEQEYVIQQLKNLILP